MSGQVGTPFSDADVHFREMATGFGRAMASFPEEAFESYYVFAGQRARVRTVGSRFASRILRAFQHLRIEGSETADLTIDLWDESETGVSALFCGGDDGLWGPGRLGSTADGRFVVHQLPYSKSALDRAGSRIVGWVGRGDRLTLHELGRPLHTPLLIWHKDRKVQALRAGLVAKRGEGVLFGGSVGSGKSTVVLCCHRAGFDCLGDDYVGLEFCPDGKARGHSLYCSTHVEPDHLRRFPDLLPHAIHGTHPADTKAVVYLPGTSGNGRRGSVVVRSVVIPRVVDAERTRIRPATKAEALLRLAPSSLLMMPFAGNEGRELDLLAGFLEEVPTFWLDLGRNLDDIPLKVGEILHQSAQM